jgi:muconolactone delta-isomerase
VLFHITQVHAPQDCPYGQGGSRSLHVASVAGVDVKAVYGAFMEHTIYLIVETDDIDALNKFLVPGMKVCTAEITPISSHPLPNSVPNNG